MNDRKRRIFVKASDELRNTRTPSLGYVFFLILQTLLAFTLSLLFQFILVLNDNISFFYRYFVMPLIVGAISQGVTTIVPNLVTKNYWKHVLLIVTTVCYSWFYGVTCTPYSGWVTLFSYPLSGSHVIAVIALSAFVRFDATGWYGIVHCVASLAYLGAAAVLLIIFFTLSIPVVALTFCFLNLVYFTYSLFLHSQLCSVVKRRTFAIRNEYSVLKYTYIYCDAIVIFCSFVPIVHTALYTVDEMYIDDVDLA